MTPPLGSRCIALCRITLRRSSIIRLACPLPRFEITAGRAIPCDFRAGGPAIDPQLSTCTHSLGAEPRPEDPPWYGEGLAKRSGKAANAGLGHLDCSCGAGRSPWLAAGVVTGHQRQYFRSHPRTAVRANNILSSHASPDQLEMGPRLQVRRYIPNLNRKGPVYFEPDAPNMTLLVISKWRTRGAPRKQPKTGQARETPSGQTGGAPPSWMGLSIYGEAAHPCLLDRRSNEGALNAELYAHKNPRGQKRIGPRVHSSNRFNNRLAPMLRRPGNAMRWPL